MSLAPSSKLRSWLDIRSPNRKYIYFHGGISSYPPKTSTAKVNPPFDDVFPIEHGNFLLSCQFFWGAAVLDLPSLLEPNSFFSCFWTKQVAQKRSERRKRRTSLSVSSLIFFLGQELLPPKTNMAIKNPLIFNRKYIFKWWIFSEFPCRAMQKRHNFLISKEHFQGLSSDGDRGFCASKNRSFLPETKILLMEENLHQLIW